MIVDEGGPAFARPAYSGQGHSTDVDEQNGMTLLDYFAGQQLAILPPLHDGISKIELFERAELCYDQARQMVVVKRAIEADNQRIEAGDSKISIMDDPDYRHRRAVVEHAAGECP